MASLSPRQRVVTATRREETTNAVAGTCAPSGLLINDIVKTLPDQIEKIATMAWKVVSFDSLPEWLRDNEYLLFHHRPPMYSIRGCIKSIFRMHTQTWNIWTHLIGFFVFLFITLSVFLFRDSITHLFEESVTISNLPWQEQTLLFLFFFSAMVCLFCSTVYHTMNNHSKKLYIFFSRLDYSGIAFLITGSSIPAYYYCFYCRPFSRSLHITVITLLCIGCLITSFWNKFNQHSYRPLRFAVFVSFGFYGAVPTVQLFLEKGLVEPYFTFLVGLVMMAVIYTGGALLYVLRIPERFSPGYFDVWGHSHQLFHICVIAAALVHYHTLVTMIKRCLEVDDCSNYVQILNQQ